MLFYTSNFNYTNPDKWYCLDDSTEITNISTIKWDNIEIWARAPNATANTIQVSLSFHLLTFKFNLTFKKLNSNYSYEGPLPADVYMWNLQRVEKVEYHYQLYHMFTKIIGEIIKCRWKYLDNTKATPSELFGICSTR